MNKQRVDYAVNRRAGIAQQKVNAYRAQQPKYPELTREEKKRLIRAGKATLRDDAYYCLPVRACWRTAALTRRCRVHC